jgi:hypothetical protein
MKFEEAFTYYREGCPVINTTPGYYMIYCPRDGNIIMCEEYSGENMWAVYENCQNEINPPGPSWADITEGNWHVGRYTKDAESKAA